MDGRARWIAVAIAGACTVLAIGVSFHAGATHDEGFTMATSIASFNETVRRAVEVELQPPLYFALLNLWLWFDQSLGFARLMSVLFAVLAGVVTVSAYRRLEPARSDSWFVVVATAMIFGHPYWIQEAMNARGYALQLLGGALLADVVVRSGVRGRADNRDVAMLAAVGVIGSYVHYAAGLVVGIVSITLLVSRILSIRQTLVVAVLGGVLTAPLVPWLSHHFDSHAYRHEESGLEALLATFQSFADLILPHAISGWRQSVVVVVVAVATVIAARRTQRRGESISDGAWVVGRISAVTVAAFVLISLKAGSDIATTRYMTFAVPCLWVTSLAFLRHAFGARAAAALLLVLQLGATYRVVKVHLLTPRDSNWGVVAETMVEDGRGAVAVVYAPTQVLAMRAELQGRLPAIGFPNDYTGAEPISSEFYRYESLDAVRQQVAKKVGDRPFWFVIPDFPIALVQVTGHDVADRFVKEHCRIVQTFEVPKTRLYLLELR